MVWSGMKWQELSVDCHHKSAQMLGEFPRGMSPAAGARAPQAPTFDFKQLTRVQASLVLEV
jgi:hypothetical protein